VPRLRRIVVVGEAPRTGTLHWDAVLAAADAVDEAALGARAEAVSPDATAFFIYTSGTTGFPKGAMHDHAIVRNVTDRASRMSSSVPIARKARKVFGPLLSGYGMSEFGVGAALSALDSTEEQCTEASGYPAPGYEIRVVDPESGREQPAGVPGEILVRSYMTMRGYYEKPVETARALDGEGWLHSGDMGLIRADGHLRFMGRGKDMLKIGGENVDPMEVEAFLMSHAAINLAAVVSFPDPRL